MSPSSPKGLPEWSDRTVGTEAFGADLPGPTSGGRRQRVKYGLHGVSCPFGKALRSVTSRCWNALCPRHFDQRRAQRASRAAAHEVRDHLRERQTAEGGRRRAHDV